MIFVLNLRPIKKEIQHEEFSLNFILEVEIIDSGYGIEKEQQQYLYIPFLELKMKQDLKRVKNNSIGMGLACSKLIINQLYGNLKLKESERGKTVFRMEMPVEKRD